MYTKSFSRLCGGVSYVLAIILTLASSAHGHTYKVVHTFTGSDGSNPEWGVIGDAAGNLYGTTSGGGANYRGSVYELSPAGGGAWTQTVLYSFTGSSDGYQPEAGLVMDSSGNLYGTTLYGGAWGGGVLFELSPNQGGWTYSILHDLEGGFNFHSPRLVFDSAGVLYGAEAAGGLYSYGEVFQLAQSNGVWTYTTLYAFGATQDDGQYPEGSVTFDSDGNLYGVTTEGGTLGYGTIFELTRGAGGIWTQTTLHSFNGRDGFWPATPLAFDKSGRMYGTTGSSWNCSYAGTIFQGTFVSGIGWTGTTLHTFSGREDGCRPLSPLVFDSSGNFYGTTHERGGGVGTVFRTLLRPGGGWSGRTLHVFSGHADGAYPSGRLLLDPEGKLYGVAAAGGDMNCNAGGGCGVVYEISH